MLSTQQPLPGRGTCHRKPELPHWAIAGRIGLRKGVEQSPRGLTMAVDMRIIRDDSDGVVLRTDRTFTSTAFPALVGGSMSVVFALDALGRMPTQMAPTWMSVGTAVFAGAIALYHAPALLFSLRTTTTVRAGSDWIEQRIVGLIWGRTRRIDARGARVSIGEREQAEKDRENDRTYAAAGLAINLIRADGKPLRLGCIDDGSAMALTDRLNAILGRGRASGRRAS